MRLNDPLFTQNILQNTGFTQAISNGLTTTHVLPTETTSVITILSNLSKCKVLQFDVSNFYAYLLRRFFSPSNCVQYTSFLYCVQYICHVTRHIQYITEILVYAYCICSSRDRLGFYADIQNLYTAYCTCCWAQSTA